MGLHTKFGRSVIQYNHKNGFLGDYLEMKFALNLFAYIKVQRAVIAQSA
jgi:hypothetical protein